MTDDDRLLLRAAIQSADMHYANALASFDSGAPIGEHVTRMLELDQRIYRKFGWLPGDDPP